MTKIVSKLTGTENVLVNVYAVTMVSIITFAVIQIVINLNDANITFGSF